MRTFMLLLVLSTLAPRALACSCAGWPTPQEKIEYSAVVFAGRVASIEEHWPKSFGEPLQWGPEYGRKITFDVSRVWKGSPATMIELWTGMGGGDCGIDVFEGVDYLIFAHWSKEGRLTAALCGGSRALVCASDDLIALGEPDKPALPEVSEPLEPYRIPCFEGPTRESGADIRGLIPPGAAAANLVVDREGRVAELELKQPDSPRMREVERIVREWCFNPAKLNGKPVAVRLDHIPEVNE